MPKSIANSVGELVFAAVEVDPDLAGFLISAVAFGIASVGAVFAFAQSKRAREAAATSALVFRRATVDILESIDLPSPPEVTLEQEIADVSESLSATVGRLRSVISKAEAFETEVKELVARADAAKVTAKLHEEDARKIALLLGSATEDRLRAEISKLVSAHDEQAERIRKSGKAMALWTFIGGVILGVVGNIVVALILG